MPHFPLHFFPKGSYLPTMPGDLLFDEKNWKIGATDKIWSKWWGNLAAPARGGDWPARDWPGDGGKGLKTPEGHSCPSVESLTISTWVEQLGVPI